MAQAPDEVAGLMQRLDAAAEQHEHDPAWQCVASPEAIDRHCEALLQEAQRHSVADDPDTPKPRQHKPTLAKIAKQAAKAGIVVARFEVEPGKIVVVPGEAIVNVAKSGEVESTPEDELAQWRRRKRGHAD
jgi:hypothetical protein